MTSGPPAYCGVATPPPADEESPEDDQPRTADDRRSGPGTRLDETIPAAASARFAVKRALTSRRPRRVTENDEFAAFARRVLRAWARRVAAGDIDAIADMAAAAHELDDAMRAAVTGLRGKGYSWAEIAARLGVTRQAAWQRWGGTRRDKAGGQVASRAATPASGPPELGARLMEAHAASPGLAEMAAQRVAADTAGSTESAIWSITYSAGTGAAGPTRRTAREAVQLMPPRATWLATLAGIAGPPITLLRQARSRNDRNGDGCGSFQVRVGQAPSVYSPCAVPG
jgi:hypothetical protein